MLTRRNLLFLLSSAGLTAASPRVIEAASQQQAEAGVTVAAPGENYLRLEDFGAVADGVTDNSAALNSALNALKATNGGTIVFPSGVTKLTGSASVNLMGKQGAVRLIGSGGNSVVHVATGTGVAIGVYNTSRLNVENITFIGTVLDNYAGELFDCAQSVINCGFVEQVTVRDCKFVGIAIGAPYGEPYNGYEPNKEHGIISVSEGDLLVERCYFGGCGTTQCGNINVNAWYGLTIRDCQFIDYGYYNGREVSKVGHVTNTAWVRALNPKQVTGARYRGKIRIERTSFDEGCQYGLFVYGAQWVDIDNVVMNNGVGPGIGVFNVVHTRIKDSFIGYINSNTGLYAYNSKHIELDSLVFGGNVKYIVLEAGVSKLVSKYSTIPGNSLYPNGIINRSRAAVEIVN